MSKKDLNHFKNMIEKLLTEKVIAFPSNKERGERNAEKAEGIREIFDDELLKGRMYAKSLTHYLAELQDEIYDESLDVTDESFKNKLNELKTINYKIRELIGKNIDDLTGGHF